MTTTALPPLPPLPEAYDIDDRERRFWHEQILARDAHWQAYATQSRADLEAENQRLREVLKAILDEQDANQGHATLETYDAARAALEKQHD